jgi:hypothetical protein
VPVDLPQVTLFAATSVGLEPTVKALQASLEQVRFARTVLFSERRPESIERSGIAWCSIDPLRSKADYSRFILQTLADHITTSHALCVQWDGFVVNGDSWDWRFLDYDYIGAVWPHFDDGKNVGNGGFSLRSKRLLEATRELPFDSSYPEDVLIGRLWRDRLEAAGIRFAPESLARRFAYERTPPSGKEFGFHGAFNLVERLSPREAFRLFRSLEPNILTRSEHLELLRWAVKRRYAAVAVAILLRLI